MIRTNSQRVGGRLYPRYLAHYAKKNHILILLGLFFLAGVTIGTLTLRSANNETIATLLRVVNGYVEKRREQTLLQNFITTAASSLTFVAIMFACGFCAISQPVIVLAPVFRGLGFGFSAASLYASYGANVTAFVAIFILPDMVISSIAILLCCRESLRLSSFFFKVLWGNRGDEPYPIRIYLGRYIAACVLCIFSAFFEATLYFAFAKFFVLG